MECPNPDCKAVLKKGDFEMEDYKNGDKHEIDLQLHCSECGKDFYTFVPMEHFTERES
jgi:hypothetical protein